MTPGQRRYLTRAALLAGLLAAVSARPQSPLPKEPAPILAYIQKTWDVLTRSNANLAAAAVDPKVPPLPGGRWPVYVATDENLGAVAARVRRTLSAADYRTIELQRLPAGPASAPGLLYLPNAYVVPGGRFNEMYGWDSFFIQVGLLRDGRLDLAKDMADNFLYEIRHYGKVLNANRTYYLSRSQPPFLSEMLLAVFQRTHDREWLAGALPALEEFYRYWTSEPHLTPQTQLSRYFDLGEGPAPEVLTGERDAEGRTHYDLVRRYFQTHPVPDYDVTQYYDRRTGQFTPLFYKGDRSMRESGFDPSGRFGPFSIDIIHYNPVCLNSLLYLMEIQIAEIMQTLNRGGDANIWRRRAEDRATRINQLLWDPRDGLYYDYEFVRGRIRRYPFLTTFYPLWAGIASRAQAERVVSNLPRFERAGGLETSTNQTGNQWDSPFGWAPLEWIAVQGLRRYGYTADADRISARFLSLVLEEYRMSGAIVEKYDVVRQSTATSGKIRFGYRSNEPGFGWTNAVFTAMFDALPPAAKADLLRVEAR